MLSSGEWFMIPIGMATILTAMLNRVKSIAGIISETLGGDVPVEAKRIGEVPGIHTARFVSEVDKLEFTHEAFSRKGFAEGAVTAAIMADGLEPGVYEFKDLIL